MQQDFVQTIKPKPSALKKELQELEITAGAAARYVGLSYPYFCNQLNGVAPMTVNTEANLKKLIKLVQEEKTRKEKNHS